MMTQRTTGDTGRIRFHQGLQCLFVKPADNFTNANPCQLVLGLLVKQHEYLLNSEVDMG